MVDLFRPGLLDGRTALVTGGGTGIGRATALELASLGARVAVTGRRAQLVEETAALAQRAGGDVLAYPCDVREPDQVDAMLDAVFNLTTQVANRSMIPHGYGKVVSVVISPRRAMPGMAHSAAARAGVESMTRTMAVEWGRHGIRLNCVAPGIIHTEAWERYGLDPDLVASALPAGVLGTPEDVAHAIVFLSTPASDYITGDTVLVDGGLDNAGPTTGWATNRG